MSSMGGSPTSRGNTPKPPDKGSFPLDHFAECKQFMRQFMDCMDQNKHVHAMCRAETKLYLSCRMEKELMKPEELSRFGLDHKIDTEKAAGVNAEWEKEKQQRYESGFVAGHHRRRRPENQ